jgi:hypothetical protein
MSIGGPINHKSGIANLNSPTKELYYGGGIAIALNVN